MQWNGVLFGDARNNATTTATALNATTITAGDYPHDQDENDVTIVAMMIVIFLLYVGILALYHCCRGVLGHEIVRFVRSRCGCGCGSSREEHGQGISISNSSEMTSFALSHNTAQDSLLACDHRARAPRWSRGYCRRRRIQYLFRNSNYNLLFHGGCMFPSNEMAAQTMRQMTEAQHNYHQWDVNQVVIWSVCSLVVSASKQPNQIKQFNSLQVYNHDTVGVSFNSSDAYFDEDVEESDQEAICHTADMLHQQRIDGKSLPHLAFHHLIQFGVPFGMAVSLIHHIDQLVVRQHHRTDGYHGAFDRSAAHNTASYYSTLSDSHSYRQFPSWYENDRTATMEPIQSLEKDGSVSLQVQQAQQAMKHRFGITLPDLRTDDNNNHLPNYTPNDGSDDNTSHYDADANTNTTTNASINDPADAKYYDSSFHSNTLSINSQSSSSLNTHSSSTSTMEQLLKDMPPNVRAAAIRHPDLVTSLLEQQRTSQRQQTQPVNQPNHFTPQQYQTKSSTFNSHPLQSTLGIINEQGKPDDDNDDDIGVNEDNYDGSEDEKTLRNDAMHSETVSLLRRRTNR